MCVACREMRPVNELIRFVADSNSKLAEPDIYKKKFGRGAYLCKNAVCIDKARKKRILQRHLKCGVNEEVFKVAEEML